MIFFIQFQRSNELWSDKISKAVKTCGDTCKSLFCIESNLMFLEQVLRDLLQIYGRALIFGLWLLKMSNGEHFFNSLEFSFYQFLYFNFHALSMWHPLLLVWC
jgi:hypothetical protein